MVLSTHLYFENRPVSFIPLRMQKIMTAHEIDDEMNFDKLHEECGVFGIYNNPDSAAHTALGLHALQHRGQEAAGIVTFENDLFYTHRAIGQVGDNFNSREVIESLPGDCAIGHVRYSTSGEKHARNIQPLFAEFTFGGLAIAHNGNLTNAGGLRKQLISQGAIFQSTMDSEIFIHLIATSKFKKVADRIIDALKQVEGAYSLVALTQKKLIAARDPLGVRPLVLGKLGNSYIFSSETCGLDIIGAEYVRDVEPGELIIIDKDGIVRAQMVNDLPIGRDIDELLRLVDAVQFADEHGEVCPAGWKKGQVGMKASPQGVVEYLAEHSGKL